MTRLKTRFAGLGLAALAVAGQAPADTIFSYNNGHDYVAMTDSQRDIYVQGLMDQWSLLLAIYDDYESLIWLEDCTQGLHSNQVAERFTDWLGAHTEDLDLTAPELFIAAIVETCEERS